MKTNTLYILMALTLVFFLIPKKERNALRQSSNPTEKAMISTAKEIHLATTGDVASLDSKELPPGEKERQIVELQQELQKIESQIRLLETKLQNEGFPEILNRDYLDQKQRSRLYKMVNQVQKWRNRRQQMQIHLINMEAKA